MRAHADWRRFQSSAEVESYLVERLPSGSSVADIEKFAELNKLSCSKELEGVIHCSARARGRWPWISAKWLVRLYVSDGELIEISVERGLTGP